jgi:hypothetical protein
LCQFCAYNPPGLLSPWTTVLLEKLTHPQSGIKFPTLHRISLACTQELHSNPYPESDILCPCPPIPFLVTPILIIPSHLCLVLQVVSILQVSSPETHTHSSLPTYLPLSLSISSLTYPILLLTQNLSQIHALLWCFNLFTSCLTIFQSSNHIQGHLYNLDTGFHGFTQHCVGGN